MEETKVIFLIYFDKLSLFNSYFTRFIFYGASKFEQVLVFYTIINLHDFLFKTLLFNKKLNCYIKVTFIKAGKWRNWYTRWS